MYLNIKSKAMNSDYLPNAWRRRTIVITPSTAFKFIVPSVKNIGKMDTLKHASSKSCACE